MPQGSNLNWPKVLSWSYIKPGSCSSYLQKTFKLISAISESSNSVDVKRVFSLTNCRRLFLLASDFGPFVRLSAIVGQSLLLEGSLFVWGEGVEFHRGFPRPRCGDLLTLELETYGLVLVPTSWHWNGTTT